MVGEGGMSLRSKQRAAPSDGSHLQFSQYSASVMASSSALYSYRSEVIPSTSPVVSASISVTSLRKTSQRGEHGRVSGWLETMKAASPPRSARSKVGDLFRSKQLLEAQYMEWATKHPSALAIFDKLMEVAKGKQIVLFLDYDGTLAPIVEDPDEAYMSDAMRAAVKKVATLIPTAIISGRRSDKVYEFVQLPELFYAGSHGMDIVGPADGFTGLEADGLRSRDEKRKEAVCYQPASEFLPMINEVYKALEEHAKNILGAKVEHNKFCATVHFRRVEEENWQLLAQEVQRVVKRYPNLCVTQGRKVLEIRPSIQWDKGKAVNYFLQTLDLGNCNNILPVYIGDDRTDEDAFHVVNQKHNGYSILVSSAPKATSATYSLNNPSEVMEFLLRLVKRCQTFGEARV
ncbi:hypothetical protein O6H91_04G027700 [Diphasiastrum complanatum]|nr:hypothetical protein O6H91_04G027700 [Diphasiastrum complanatum]KAJ7558194.1 hypothetical protein O6H91_04G027700 [Diphasiastrum complanatum]